MLKLNDLNPSDRALLTNVFRANDEAQDAAVSTAVVYELVMSRFAPTQKDRNSLENDLRSERSKRED